MRDWGSHAVNTSHIVFAAVNIAAWLLTIHRRPLHGVANLAAAVFIVGLNFYWRRSGRKLEQLMVQRREIEVQLQALRALTVEESSEADGHALMNLRKVAKTLGAETSARGDVARIRLGGVWFHISERHICRTDRSGGVEYTCLNFGTFGRCVPLPEQIASTLLLLKNDPKIFKRWKKKDRFYA